VLDRKMAPRIKLYDGAFHMLMHEPCKDEVYNDIQTFILQICDAEWAGGGMDGPRFAAGDAGPRVQPATPRAVAEGNKIIIGPAAMSE
jgi:hypothetical protein